MRKQIHCLEYDKYALFSTVIIVCSAKNVNLCNFQMLLIKEPGVNFLMLHRYLFNLRAEI